MSDGYSKKGMALSFLNYSNFKFKEQICFVPKTSICTRVCEWGVELFLQYHSLDLPVFKNRFF